MCFIVYIQVLGSFLFFASSQNAVVDIDMLIAFRRSMVIAED